MNEPACPADATRVRREPGDCDTRARVRRMDEQAVPDVQADMPEPVEEEQVAGFQVPEGDRSATLELADGVVRQRDTDTPVDVTDEPGAVEAGSALATPDVRDAELLTKRR